MYVRNKEGLATSTTPNLRKLAGVVQKAQDLSVNITEKSTCAQLFAIGHLFALHFTEHHKYNPAMKRYVRCVVVVAVALSALAVVTYGQQSDDEKLMAHDQDVIDGCWQEAKGTDLTPTQVQVTIEACMDLEAVYRYNWGTDPRPQSMGV